MQWNFMVSESIEGPEKTNLTYRNFELPLDNLKNMIMNDRD